MSQLSIIEQNSPNTSVKSFESIRDLITVDTLKTMQVLGFNYRAAIGEPLTQICSEAILNLGKTKNTSNNNRRI